MFISNEELSRIWRKIARLEKELQVQKYDDVEEIDNYGYLIKKPTLKGKIDALAKKLNVEFETKSGTPARVVCEDSVIVSVSLSEHPAIFEPTGHRVAENEIRLNKLMRKKSKKVKKGKK